MTVDGGKLDRRLELMAAGLTTGVASTTDAFGQIISDDFGQTIQRFETVATVYAQRLEMRTKDAARAGGRETFAIARYLIRYRADISTAMRVRVDGRLYDILSIEEPDRRATLILTLEEVTR